MIKNHNFSLDGSGCGPERMRECRIDFTIKPANIVKASDLDVMSEIEYNVAMERAEADDMRMAKGSFLDIPDFRKCYGKQ